MWPLPVENLFMVGRATKTKLHKLGIFTIKDLATADPKFLEKHLKSHGLLIWNFANGIENSPVISENLNRLKVSEILQQFLLMSRIEKQPI